MGLLSDVGLSDVGLVDPEHTHILEDTEQGILYGYFRIIIFCA